MSLVLASCVGSCHLGWRLAFIFENLINIISLNSQETLILFTKLGLKASCLDLDFVKFRRFGVGCWTLFLSGHLWKLHGIWQLTVWIYYVHHAYGMGWLKKGLLAYAGADMRESMVDCMVMEYGSDFRALLICWLLDSYHRTRSSEQEWGCQMWGSSMAMLWFLLLKNV